MAALTFIIPQPTAGVGLPALAGQAQQGIGWLLDQSQPLPETDWNAASANLGMTGSQFGDNRQLVLRDSERRDRLQQGNEMLQPYLEREQQQRLQREQLEAEAARQLISEAGLDRRLSAENAARLELALLQGNQEAARQLVSEGGLNSRQAAALQAEMDRARMSTSASLLQTLLQVASRPASTSGTASAAPTGSYRWQTTPDGGTVTGGTPPPAGYNRPRTGNNLGRITADVDRILQQYGLSGGGGGVNLQSYLQ
jgi:hypothetical protein